MRLLTVLLVVSLGLGLDGRAAKDTAFYRYADGNGGEVIVQGLDQVPLQHRLWADKVVVGEHYGGKARPKPPPPPPIVAAPATAASPCAPAESLPWWSSVIPEEPVRRWLSIVSLAASLALAIWLFRAIKFVVWLRALITMSPVLFVVGVLSGCSPIGCPPRAPGSRATAEAREDRRA